MKRDMLEWIGAFVIAAVFWAAMFGAVAIAYPAP